MANIVRTFPSKCADPRTPPDGFILVTVLWILGALSALISIYAVFVINTALSFSVHEHRFRSEALISAALELTAYRQLASPARSRTNNHFNFRMDRANINVEYRSEASRIDLNAAPKELLVGLFVALGSRREHAEIYGDHIVNWRTPRPTGVDLEAPSFRSAGLAPPRGGKFPHSGELALVHGLPSNVAERALPFLTVYGGPQINIFEAAPQVIAALPGLTRERADAVLASRGAPQTAEKTLLPLLGPAQKYVTLEGSNVLRVTIRVTFDNGRRLNAEVVMLLFDVGDVPYAVLTRADDQEQWGSAGLGE